MLAEPQYFLYVEKNYLKNYLGIAKGSVFGFLSTITPLIIIKKVCGLSIIEHEKKTQNSMHTPEIKPLNAIIE